ncbi:Crp/Fnr family transcriptional regulator [Bradyrhizobium sp. USDA 4471]
MSCCCRPRNRGVCNAAHSVKQRRARWLLVASNALEDDKLPLTHEVLAHLLGVRRASVTECLEALEKGGAIHSLRGLVNIINSHALGKSPAPASTR